MAATTGGIRIAELVATLSYAADLGLGQPMQHCMRQAVIALRLADLAGAEQHEREATYYLGLLMNVYCHADASEQAAWFGDDLTFKSDGIATFGMSTPQIIAFLLRRVASHGGGVERARRLATFPVTGMRAAVAFMTTHATLGSQFVARIGLDDAVVTAVSQAYEQWDGKGQPRGLRGAQIGLPARLVHVASPVEVYARRQGIEAARLIVRRNAGTQFDPSVADLFDRHAPAVLDGLDEAASWGAIIATEPELAGRMVHGADLDAVLESIADMVDLKSPWLAGHSRGVANLVAEAARQSGLPEAEVTTLRRAGLIHDLGRLGVPNTIWDKPAPLSDAERERVRMHPYLTDRMLARLASFDRIREIAARHHERLDGSGYPSALTAAVLSPADRLLAAADVYHAMTEPRPHRPAHDPDRAAATLRAEVTAGRLDGAAVTAVLAAAGHRATARRDWPDRLTAREVDVLSLLARGHTTRQIAQRLVVTPKTASNHIEHIYAKLGVTSRAAATLYATQHGLVGTYTTGA